jgi:hypothetical protein
MYTEHYIGYGFFVVVVTFSFNLLNFSGDDTLKTLLITNKLT